MKHMKLPGSLPTSRDCADIRHHQTNGLAVLVPEVGSTWCLCESGACGPTFTFPEITTGPVFLRFFSPEICKIFVSGPCGLCSVCSGFTAIFVSGPIERGVFLESGHNDREANMPRPSVTGQCDRNCDRTSPKRSEVLTATLYGGKTRREWCFFFNENKTPWRTNIQSS